MPLGCAIRGLPSSSLPCGVSGRCNSILDHLEVQILSFIVVRSESGAFHCPTFSDRKFRRIGRRKLNASAGIHVVDNAPSRASSGAASTGTIEIPVTCYQIIGVSDQAEKDEIVKSVINLKKADVEEGYTMETVAARQDLLVDLRDKLLFEPEFAGNIKEKIAPKSPLKIPWAWLPGALCLLQEVGEENLVLEIGQAVLRHHDSKSYIHDILLSMALAECAIAKVAFENGKVSQGFEALARAQCLLKRKGTLGNMTLLSQIEESLEELAPACTLELLGMLRSPENAERRRGAIAALRELLRQGLDAETSSQVQDWPCFLSQALSRLMATEIVDLLPWDTLAIRRKNKKSLESHNQRGVIDFNCFYLVLIAHIAVGFSSKQTELISKAKTICECLMALEGVDLKFEEALCSFLLGQGTEVDAIEKLKQLESSCDSAIRNSIMGKELSSASGATPSLETWLKESVLGIFSDTRDCSPSLAIFFRAEKKYPGNKKMGGTPIINNKTNHRPLSSMPLERRDFEDSITVGNSSRQLCTAVKQLALGDLQNPLVSTKNIDENNGNIPSVQLKRSLGLEQNKIWESWLSQSNLIKGLSFVALLGFTTFFTLKLSSIRFSRGQCMPLWVSAKLHLEPDLSLWRPESQNLKSSPSPGNTKGILGNIRTLMDRVQMQHREQEHSDSLFPRNSHLPVALSNSMTEMHRRSMPKEEAEELVRHWENIKAEALGPTHRVHSLLDVLDESMLTQWQTLAETAKARSCFWRFVLLQLTILQAHIFPDGITGEMAEIEALLEEAAELVDDSQPKNANYYSTYKIRYILKKQEDSSWKFCEGNILKRK